ncbi:hypothetical protein [Streptomyces goshikiensis]
MARIRFPDDPLQIQIGLIRTYTALSDRPATTSPTALRRSGAR